MTSLGSVLHRLKVRRDLWVVTAILAAALVVRLLYVLETQSSVLGRNHFFLDPHTHDLLALKIARENFWGTGPFFRAPLYPYFLGVIYFLFGHSHLIPRLIQAFVGTGSCMIAYLMGRKLFGDKVALLALIFVSMYWVLIYYDGELLIPVLSVFLNLLLLFLLVRPSQTGFSGDPGEFPLPGRRLLLGAGLVLGLSALARPNILVFGPCVVVWLTTVGRRFGWRRILTLSCFLGAGALIAVLPVTLRNHVVGKDIVLISSQGGVNFFIGNNSKSDGKTPVQPAYVSPYEDYLFRTEHKGNIWLKDNVWRVSKIVAEEASGRELRPSEVSRFWYLQSTKFITRKPWSFLLLLLKKVYFFWNAYEIPSNDNIHEFVQSNSRILKYLSYFHFGILAPLALLGMGLCLKEWKRYLLLYLYVAGYSFSIVLFFVTCRYRVPLLPVLLLFAAHTVVWLYRKISGGKYRQLLVAGVVLAALFLTINSSFFGVREEVVDIHYELGW